MAFISSSNTSSGKGEVPTASSQVSTISTEVAAASLSYDTICAYIATQSSGIDGIGWDWSYMANEDENHALVADDVVLTEFALMAIIRVLERDVEIRDNKIESLKNELEELKKEKESIDHKLAGFVNASKDLNDLLESQKSAKDKTGVGFNEYTVVPLPPAQVYSPPQRDLSWTGLPEFVMNTALIILGSHLV
ncbi:hypothetical protein Tco_0629012 [Tanacetum coccineum]|uniref:Uncharacterized protein n=1 Tax=Tanacetum coccineum TaxID=301880 RepID=A0ABQ4WS45_9ASTR